VICAEGVVVASAHATDVNLVGLADRTAILVIDGGKPRLLRVGQTRAGVRLISVRSDDATVRVDGEQRELPLGGLFYSSPLKSSTPVSLTLVPDSRGHYISPGSINGSNVRFMVDTGATMVSMDASQAKRAGINYLAGQKAVATTANGPVQVYLVKLDTVQVGDILLRDIGGVVHVSSELSVVLLGMSFLTRLDMFQENENLTLKQRF
jgi:aspartyl protease family protein